MTTRPLTHAPATVASLGRRFAGFLLDGVAAALVAVPLAVGLASSEGARTLLVAVGASLVVLLVVLQWVWHGRLGWTIGRLVLGMRTVDVESLRPIGLGRVLLRGLVVAAGSLVLGVGQVVVLVSPAFDRTGRNRGWHDRAARDEVVDVRAPAPAAPAWRDEAVDVRVPAGAPQPAVPRQPAGRPQPSVPPQPSAPPRPEAPVPAWLSALDGSEVPTVTGSQPLLLAPLAPREHGPDVDTRAIPVVRTPALQVQQRKDSHTPVLGVPAATQVATRTDPHPVGLDPVPRDSGRPDQVGLDPEVEQTRRSVPRPTAAPVEAPSTTAELAFSDGRRIVVDGVALVGRNPAAAVDVQIVRVIDPGRSVSKTHLQVAVTPGGVWVADRGSTNGTVVTLPDGAQVVCPVDQPIRLRPGSTVAFGDYSFVVVRGPATAS